MAELNLIPPHLKEKEQQRLKTRNYILFGITALVIILISIYIPVSELINVKSEELSLMKQAEQTDGASINEENENIKKEIENYKEYIEKVEYLTQNKILISNKIHELEQYVTQDVIFDSLAYGENGLTINATAQSLESISVFTANIQISGAYKTVRVSNIRKDEQTAADSNTGGSSQYKFTINAYD